VILGMLVLTILLVILTVDPLRHLAIIIRHLLLALVTMTLGKETAIWLLLLITEVVAILNLLIVVLRLLPMLPTIAIVVIPVIQNMLAIHRLPLLCRLDDLGRLLGIAMTTLHRVNMITEIETVAGQ
jgi:hypothetical protein